MGVTLLEAKEKTSRIPTVLFALGKVMSIEILFNEKQLSEKLRTSIKQAKKSRFLSFMSLLSKGDNTDEARGLCQQNTRKCKLVT